MNSTDIVGYTYKADNHHPECVIHAGLADGSLAPAARDIDVDWALHQWVHSVGGNPTDEHTYDSGDAPKVIFADQVDDNEVCGTCLMPLAN